MGGWEGGFGVEKYSLKKNYKVKKYFKKASWDKKIVKVWEDEKGVDAAVLASAQQTSTFASIPGLSGASRWQKDKKTKRQKDKKTKNKRQKN